MSALLDKNIRTLADVIERLGGVAPDRVRFRPTPGTAKLDDLLTPGNYGCELVDGTLVERAVGDEESFLGSFLLILVNAHVVKYNLGYCTGEQGFLRLAGGTVRGPDIRYTSWDRLPGGHRPTDAIPCISPELVIEVLSSGNTRAEMARKRKEYFASGVVRVWEVDPRGRTITVYSSVTRKRVFGVGDTLDASPALPGLVLNLADVFSELDRTRDTPPKQPDRG